MALEKTFTLENDTTGNYWKIISTNVANKEITSVEVGLWKTKTASDDGKAMIRRVFIGLTSAITLANQEGSEQNTYKLAYASIKAGIASSGMSGLDSDFFDDADDV